MEVKPLGTLLLTRDDLCRLLGPADYLEIAETAFRAHAEGRILAPALMHVDADAGEFHIKAGGMLLERAYFALKSNGGFFGNAERFGLPPIQGVILLCDAENGYPLALMDSTAITLGRTGATTALAAQHLAVRSATTVTICGCGNQGSEHLRYIKRVRPIARAYAWDIDPRRAAHFATHLGPELGIEVIAGAPLDEAMAASDICITCTPAHAPFIMPEHVHPGIFIAAVGADSPDKQELHPDVLAAAKIVVDLVEQCAIVGELHHGLDAGTVTLADVHANLGEIITARKCGRTSDTEAFVFDATGTALQDVAAAAAAYVRAASDETGRLFDFFSRK